MLRANLLTDNWTWRLKLFDKFATHVLESCIICIGIIQRLVMLPVKTKYIIYGLSDI